MVRVSVSTQPLTTMDQQGIILAVILAEGPVEDDDNRAIEDSDSEDGE